MGDVSGGWASFLGCWLWEAVRLRDCYRRKMLTGHHHEKRTVSALHPPFEPGTPPRSSLYGHRDAGMRSRALLYALSGIKFRFGLAQHGMKGMEVWWDTPGGAHVGSADQWHA